MEGMGLSEVTSAQKDEEEEDAPPWAPHQIFYLVVEEMTFFLTILEVAVVEGIYP